ncbi:hypothetical protein JRQ81_001888 [Phrynocephalus forsythii]|uniref:Uncharacterized protein n=1 Tax=Phrynocephalus forsythii TaxID=171643 RepID=A0A9Q0Y972_9SAUR|nr:hypothetical protein JRQ81_001888 [Phrynocephalus forsythii]
MHRGCRVHLPPARLPHSGEGQSGGGSKMNCSSPPPRGPPQIGQALWELPTVFHSLQGEWGGRRTLRTPDPLQCDEGGRLQEEQAAARVTASRQIDPGGDKQQATWGMAAAAAASDVPLMNPQPPSRSWRKGGKRGTGGGCIIQMPLAMILHQFIWEQTEEKSHSLQRHFKETTKGHVCGEPKSLIKRSRSSSIVRCLSKFLNVHIWP